MLPDVTGLFSLDLFPWGQALVGTFIAILFLQSGFDKVFDRKGNLDWLTGHFSKSILSDSVPVLLTVLTGFELVTGAVSAGGVVEVVIFRTYGFSELGTLLAAIVLIMLFFGQRMAKDYEGAANLVPYFILVVLNLYLLG